MIRPLLIAAAATSIALAVQAAEPLATCEDHLRHGRTAQAKTCYTALTQSADPALRAEGFWHTGDKFKANEAFRLAVKQHPEDPRLRVRWGLLYFEQDQPGDATDLFGEALAIDKQYAPALLGLAKVYSRNFDRRGPEMAASAVKADPKSAAAQAMVAQLALEDNNPKKALEEAEKALALDPESLEALSVRAAIDAMEDKPSDAWTAKILKINPVYGEAFAVIGNFYVLNRRYEEGIAALRKALSLDPNLWYTRAELGIQLMRQGNDTEARELLKYCYDNGFQGNTTVNALRLIDSYRNFETYKTDHSILRLKKKEAEVLRPFVQAEIDNALATYDKKYKMKLPGPVGVELYPDHEDFAVRTMGMPGLGALGVTFGLSVAMDSPSARAPGKFHWASTLWHELSHVYVLTATKHRVPRWFTEGVAVYEETATHADWGDRLDPEAIAAIKEKRLLPIAELDRGYIHPSYPAQVVVSYFQGGQVCTYIVERWGWDKILAMMKDFAAVTPTADVVEKELGIKAEQFDKDFLEWLTKRTKTQVENFDAWKEQMKGLAGNVSAKKWDEVIAQGPRIRGLYPDYLEGDNAYEFLAEAYTAKGDKAAAMRELEAYSREGGKNPATVKRLAVLQTEAGLKEQAAATLERLNFIYPQDEELHQKLGSLYFDLGRTPLAIREFEVLVATKPNDLAGARYQLALAYQKAGRIADAKSQVVDALEVAPGFRPAQKLLLELNRAAAPPQEDPLPTLRKQ